jgi:hypothetical protein
MPLSQRCDYLDRFAKEIEKYEEQMSLLDSINTVCDYGLKFRDRSFDDDDVGCSDFHDQADQRQSEGCVFRCCIKGLHCTSFVPRCSVLIHDMCS